MLDQFQFINTALGVHRELIDIIERYNEPHRYYHNIEHLTELLEKIEQGDYKPGNKITLALIALFHDAVYDPRKQDNEEKSAALAEVVLSKLFEKELVSDVVQAILDTKNHHLAKSEVSKQFCALDLASLLEGDFARLIKDEKKLFKEFQFRDVATYKQGREKFLTAFMEQWKGTDDVFYRKMQHYIEYIKAWVPKIGIYAGSFNPFHVGHLDILEKAEQVFDKVVVARGINTQKMPVLTGKFIKPFKDIEVPEIKATGLDKILPTHETIFFTTLLTDVVEHYRSMGEVTVVRGLRNGFDLQAESNLVAIIKDIDPMCNVIYIPCDNNLAHVSSSAIRELASFDANNTRYLVNKFAYLEQI